MSQESSQTDDFLTSEKIGGYDSSASPTSACTTDRNTTKTASHIGEEVAWLSAPRLIDHPWMSVEDWKRRVETNMQAPHRNHTRLVFMGDSITEGWTDVAPNIWEQHFGRHHPLRLGIGGDQTQNLLWRIDRGELDGLSPKVLMLLIGVNNIWWGGFDPDAAAKGIAAVASKIRAKLPHTKIFAQALFPAGQTPNDELRQKIHATNKAAHILLRPIQNLEFVDIGSVFVADDGHIAQDIMHDYLHLTEKGYALWAKAIFPLLAKEMD